MHSSVQSRGLARDTNEYELQPNKSLLNAEHKQGISTLRTTVRWRLVHSRFLIFFFLQKVSFKSLFISGFGVLKIFD